MKRVVNFISGNKKKVEEVIAILPDSFPLTLVNKSLDLAEYQGDPESIARDKCKLAATLAKGPVIIEDTSLCFNSFGGLPGPYIKWFLSNLGPEGLYKMLSSFPDKSAYAQCILAYSDGPDEEVILFKGRTDGHIVSPQGNSGFGWDPCFLPNGHDKTYAQITKDEKNKISHRYKAVKAMVDHFSNVNN